MLFRYLSFPVGGNLSFVRFCDNRIRLVGWYDGRACVSLCPPKKTERARGDVAHPLLPFLLPIIDVVYSLFSS